ncbi:hypothetical protein D3C86_1412090 [compost metagenome]
MQKLGLKGSTKDFERLGGDNMFGFKLEWGGDRNVLNNEVKLFEGGFIADQFMEKQGYAKAERVHLEERKISSLSGDSPNEKIDMMNVYSLEQKGE